MVFRNCLVRRKPSFSLRLFDATESLVKRLHPSGRISLHAGKITARRALSVLAAQTKTHQSFGCATIDQNTLAEYRRQSNDDTVQRLIIKKVAIAS
jgi:hypothetical protein